MKRDERLGLENGRENFINEGPHLGVTRQVGKQETLYAENCFWLSDPHPAVFKFTACLGRGLQQLAGATGPWRAGDLGGGGEGTSVCGVGRSTLEARLESKWLHP